MLEVKHLCTSFLTRNGQARAVDDVSFVVEPGKIVGIVGESGCGKTMIARSIMGLCKPPGKVVGGEIWLDGTELTRLSEKERCALRGKALSMIFQDPMTSLNPVVKVGPQVEETLRLHENLPRSEARKRVIEVFEEVGIPEPQKRYSAYPHELSGGLRQRVMIAMAMVCRPSLLIADEPTTALDVTVGAQILRLMKELCKKGTSIILISHNLGAIAQVCDEVNVMYAGRIVEQADVYTLFDHPMHPYTRGLLEAVSSLGQPGRSLQTIPGMVPDIRRLPSGCSFSPRCSLCERRCSQERPELLEVEGGHFVRCHRSGQMPEEGTWKEGSSREEGRL